MLRVRSTETTSTMNIYTYNVDPMGIVAIYAKHNKGIHSKEERENIREYEKNIKEKGDKAPMKSMNGLKCLCIESIHM